MSTSPTGPDINTLDLNELRQLLKDPSSRQRAQADHITIVEKARADADLTLLAQTTNSFPPVAANLSANLNVAAPMDTQQVNHIFVSNGNKTSGNFSTIFDPPVTHRSQFISGFLRTAGFHWTTRSIFTSWTSNLKWTFSFSFHRWFQHPHLGGYRVQRVRQGCRS